MSLSGRKSPAQCGTEDSKPADVPAPAKVADLGNRNLERCQRHSVMITGWQNQSTASTEKFFSVLAMARCIGLLRRLARRRVELQDFGQLLVVVVRAPVQSLSSA